MRCVTLICLFSLALGDLSDVPGHTVDDLEREVMTSNNDIFKEDFTEIKYLQEKVDALRNENKFDEAVVLERRVKRKIENLREDMSRPQRFPKSPDFDRHNVPEEFRGDMEARMKEREEVMRARFERDRENILKGRRGFDPSVVDGETGAIPDDVMQNYHQRHSMDELHRVHKDIAERHKELIEHRQRDITERIESAGFSNEEEGELKEKLNEYLRLETEVMESRASDKAPDRHAKYRSQSKEERMREKDAMKERRNQEREKMDQAREMRKEIDSRIREKMTANREF